MKILIAGDVVPTSTNCKLFVDGNIVELFGCEMVNMFKQADYRIVNMEAPLLDEGIAIDKCGPNLSASPSALKALKGVGIDLVTLANNHIYDYGEAGMRSTCEVLTENGIDYVGVGSNVLEAAKPYMFEKEDIKIGVYACADYEFSIADNKRAGANPFDPIESLDHIVNAKKECDYLIVLYHGGKEFYRYPSPRLRKICQKMIQKGADLVVVQHTHCIGAIEEYLDGTIVYGQGNFIFDSKDDEYWDSGLIIELNVKKRESKINYYPIKKYGSSVRMAQEDERDRIMNDLKQRSVEIKDEKKLEELYNAFAKENYNMYLRMISGNISRRFWMKVLYKLSKGNVMKFLFSKKSLLSVINCIECDAHRELFLTGIKSMTEKQ